MEPACNHQAKHAEVADKRPEGMPEGRRPVPLNEEVTSPCEPVANGEEQQREPRMPKRKRDDHNSDTQYRPQAMQRTVSGMAVLL